MQVVIHSTWLLAQALLSNRSRDIWSETYTIKGHNQTLPCSIDGATCDKENANVFYEKYNKLYTSVPYDKDDMSDIKSQMNNDIKKENNTDYVIIVVDVVKAIEHLKQGKSGGEEGLWSDNIIHGTHTLYVLVTLVLMLY